MGSGGSLGIHVLSTQNYCSLYKIKIWSKCIWASSPIETQLSSDKFLRGIEQYFSFIVVGYFKKKTKNEIFGWWRTFGKDFDKITQEITQLKMDVMNDKHPIWNFTTKSAAMMTHWNDDALYEIGGWLSNSILVAQFSREEKEFVKLSLSLFGCSQGQRYALDHDDACCR